MAKKKKSNEALNKRIKARDKATLSKIVDMADDVDTNLRTRGAVRRRRYRCRDDHVHLITHSWSVQR